MSDPIRTGDELRDWCKKHSIGSPELADALGMTLASASNILAGRQWAGSVPTARQAAVDALVAQHNCTDMLAVAVANPEPVAAAEPEPERWDVPAANPFAHISAPAKPEQFPVSRSTCWRDANPLPEALCYRRRQFAA